jgi:hypothetical protein
MSTSSEDYAHTAKENQTFFNQNEIPNYSWQQKRDWNCC